MVGDQRRQAGVDLQETLKQATVLLSLMDLGPTEIVENWISAVSGVGPWMGMWTTNFILKQFDNFIDTKCIVAAKLVKVRKQQLRGLVFKMENPFCINRRNKIFTFFPIFVSITRRFQHRK